MKTTQVDRLLAVSDWASAAQVNNYKKYAHHNAFLKERAREIWEDCDSLQEFCERANISPLRAKELDRDFSILGNKRLANIKGVKTISKLSDSVLCELF